MLQKKIIQIIPTLPPNISGLGDVGYTIAEYLFIKYNIKTDFLISDMNYSVNKIEDYAVFKFSKNYNSFYHELRKLIAGGSNKVLLHYVNYAYQKRGVPYYVPIVLRRIKHDFKDVKIIINFHELYAKGNFPSSSFFLYPLQRKIFEMLVDTGDIFVTSMGMYGRIIKQTDKTKRKVVINLPVFSNVGELNECNPLNHRKKQIVVFGSKVLRKNLYKNYYYEIIAFCHKIGIKKIIDIGEKTEYDFSATDNIELVETGILNSNKISTILSDSIAGVIFYPAAYLAKSSVFAAYAAHGLPVLCFTKTTENEDGLVEGTHFISLYNNLDLNLNIISENIFYWYKNHSISIHICEYLNKLNE